METWIVYKYKENVCDFMASQAYVKGREATPFKYKVQVPLSIRTEEE